VPKSEEATEVAWVAPAEVPRLEIEQSMRLRIEHGLEVRAEPFLS
jgi:hypothetical protein